MTLTYDFTLDDLVAFNRHHLRHSPSHKRTRFFVRVLFIPMAAIPVVLRLLQGQDVLGLTLTMGVIAVIWFFAYPPIFDRRVESQIRRALNEGSNRGLVGEHTLTITPEGLRSTSPGGDSFYKWASVEKVEQTESYIFVYVASVQAIVIPKQTLQGTPPETVLGEIYRFALQSEPRDPHRVGS